MDFLPRPMYERRWGKKFERRERERGRGIQEVGQTRLQSRRRFRGSTDRLIGVVEHSWSARLFNRFLMAVSEPPIARLCPRLAPIFASLPTCLPVYYRPPETGYSTMTYQLFIIDVPVPLRFVAVAISAVMWIISLRSASLSPNLRLSFFFLLFSDRDFFKVVEVNRVVDPHKCPRQFLELKSSLFFLSMPNSQNTPPLSHFSLMKTVVTLELVFKLLGII